MDYYRSLKKYLNKDVSRKGRFWRFLYFFLVLSSTTYGQSNVQHSRFVEGLDFPWEILWGSDNHLWITQTTGAILRYDLVFDEIDTLIKLPVAVNPNHANQAALGLFGLAIHPEFPETPWVYTMYNYDLHDNTDTLRTRISRFTYESEPKKLTDEVIFLDNYNGYDKHSGGRMIITQDNKLLVTTGDEFIRPYAQRMDRFNGKTLRFNLDGSVPQDNPFVNEVSGDYRYIYSLGHRNPQGLIQTSLGTIFSSEHGPNSDDEINSISSGRNYGWPWVKGYCDNNYPGTWTDNIAEGEESELAPYFGTTNHRADLYPFGYEDEDDYCNNFEIEEPVFSFLNERAAPSGLEYYGSNVIPEWENSLLLATLRGKHIRRFELNEAQNAIISDEILFSDTFDRVRDLAVTPFGDIYVVSSEREDNNINSLFRISIEDDLDAGSNLTVETMQDNSLLLSWTANVDYLSFFVITRFNSDSEMDLIDTLDYTHTSFIDTSVAEGACYNYTLQTLRRGEELGSETIIYNEIDCPVDLNLPHDLTVQYDETSMGLLIKWEAAVDAFSSFIINRMDENDHVNIDTVSMDESEYIDTSIISGVTYGYTIQTLRGEEIVGETERVYFNAVDFPVELTFPFNFNILWDDLSKTIQLQWEAEVDIFTSFIINRSDAIATISLDTLSSDERSYIDDAYNPFETYGYVIKTLRGEEIIASSDSVIFDEDDYPAVQEPLSTDLKDVAFDIFQSDDPSNFTQIHVTIVDLSGKKRVDFRGEWKKWLDERNNLVPQNLLFGWRASLLDALDNEVVVSGKHISHQKE